MFDQFDALLLARFQFAFTISFHFIFPSFSIGLASYLAVLEGLWLWTGREVYLNLFKYWLKIFALAFAMGVVSGIVMSYQFGTNWAVFSDKAGPIVGPLMAYEVLTAFFLEAGFLGIMLFGMGRVGRKLHFVGTLAVAIGTCISAFWILSANSWMQTPVGYSVNEAGQFVPEDWWTIVFNPSFPYRLVHTVLAAYLTTALVVGGVGAWHLLRDHVNQGARAMFSMAMGMIAVVAPLQILVGDLHGLNALEHQPAKIMATEGHFKSHPEGAPLILFGIPDQEAGTVRYAVEIPKVSSLILKHDLNAPLNGLDTVPRANWPYVPVVFWAFRIMVGLGTLMLGLGALSLWARFRGRLYDWRPLHWLALAMGPAGFVAVIAGWVTAEAGRQPFTVYGLLRTAESVSPLEAPAVAASLMTFIVVYFIVFGAGTGYILKLMGKAPHPGETGPEEGPDHPIRTAGITPATLGRSQPHPRRGGQIMTTLLDLPNLWAFVIAFAVFAYVVMDGFDLGIGILFPFFSPGPDRDRAMNSVAPVWDGNETWLVLGGGGLMAAFPLAYAIILPALYAPIIAMVLALIFRGVAFEFRWRDPGHRRYWDVAFTTGSVVATLAQGITLGALLQGIAVEGRSYAGGWWDWLTPFSLLVGVSLVIGYALLGATWLVMKTEGAVQDHSYRLAGKLALGLIGCIGLVSAATPFLSGAYYERWFAWPQVLFTAQVPLLVGLCSGTLLVSLMRRWEYWPFLLTLGLFALCLLGLGVSMFPYVVPNAVTIHEAAAPHASLQFMLVGASVLIPIILAYTGYSYWVFRGKTGHEGYH